MYKSPIFACALLALSPIPSICHAEPPSKFDLVLGGDAFFTAGLIHQNTDANAAGQEFMNRFRLKVTATAVADNGLTYGARVRLRASIHTGILDADQAYTFVQGGFGTVELGTQLNPAMFYHVTAPANFGTGGVDGDWAIGDTGWIQNQLTFLEPYAGGGYTVVTFVKEANRINYLSPRLSSDDDPRHGVMAMASYAPANRSVLTGSGRATINHDAVGNHPYGYGRTQAFSNCGGGPFPIGCNYQNVHELGLRDDETIHGVTVRGGLSRLGGSTGRTDFGAPQSYYDLSAWQAGLQLGASGVLIGGGYANAGKSAYPHESPATGRLYQDDQFTWTAGLSYETGAIAVGVNYEYGHDAGDLTVPGARSARLYAVGLTYKLAPGLTTALEYMRSATRNEAGFVSDPLGFRQTSSGNANLVLWKTEIAF